MKYQVWLVLVLLLSALVRADAANAPSCAYVEALVEPVALTDLVSVAGSGLSPWIIVKVTPGPISGVLALADINEFKAGTVTMYGDYTVVDSLGCVASISPGKYSWPATSFWRLPLPLDVYRDMQFRSVYPADGSKIYRSKGVSVLCLYTPNAGDGRVFEDASVVPDGWQGRLADAVAYLRQHTELRLSGAEATRDAWAALLHDSNPYLESTTTQVLAIHGELTVDDMAVILSGKDTEAATVAVCISYLSGWFDLSSNRDWALKQEATAKSLADLDLLAVGMFAGDDLSHMFALDGTMYGSYHGTHDYRLYGQLLAAVRKRLTALDPNGTAADDAWFSIDNACRSAGT